MDLCSTPYYAQTLKDCILCTVSSYPTGNLVLEGNTSIAHNSCTCRMKLSTYRSVFIERDSTIHVHVRYFYLYVICFYVVR